MVNYVAVLVSSILAMVIGGFWYSPFLFGKMWMKLSGLTQKDMEACKKKGMAKYYLVQFIASLLTAFVLAMFLGLLSVTSIMGGLQVAFWVWLGFNATQMVGCVLWEGKPVKLYILNVAHQLVNLLVMGVVLAAWH